MLSEFLVQPRSIWNHNTLLDAVPMLAPVPAVRSRKIKILFASRSEASMQSIGLTTSMNPISLILMVSNFAECSEGNHFLTLALHHQFSRRTDEIHPALFHLLDFWSHCDSTFPTGTK